MENQRQHRLVIIEGPDAGRTYQLQGMICTLGRASDNTIMLDSSRISRHHAQIRLLPAGAVLEDMGSTNGTFVNNRRVTEPHRLSPGDVIRLADYVTMEYEVEGTVRTEVLPSGGQGGTQVVPGGPGYPPPSPFPEEPPAYEYEEPDPVAAPQEVVYEPYAPALQYDTPAPPAAPPTQKRPRGLYIVIGILAVLLCLCIALGVYLWFAPITFWEKLFDLLGIPMPSGTLIMLATWVF